MENYKKRIIIAAGGTGGHFYPGLALAQYFRNKNWEILFLVKNNDISLPYLKEAGYSYVEADLLPFPRSFNPLAQLSFLYHFIKALIFVRMCLKDYMPNAVFSTGGYVGFTSVLAAKLTGISSFIHESNSVSGLANSVSMLFCKKIFLGMPLKRNLFPKKTVITGTPLRESFSNFIPTNEARKKLGLAEDKFTVLVFGGSQGADRLNMAVLSAFLVMNSKMQLIHITGEKNYKKLQEAYTAHKLISSANLLLSAYRDDMPVLYSAADLVICRAGASTISELVQLEKPAILVPYPYAAGNHQYYNACTPVKAGACICLEEKEMFFKDLELLLQDFLSGKKSVSEMTGAYKSIAIPKGLHAAEIAGTMIEQSV